MSPDKGRRNYLIYKELWEIVNADKKARERVSDSSELSKRMQIKLDEDRKMLDEKYAEESERTIKEKTEKQRNTLEKMETSYNERFSKTENAINELYEKKKNAWISEIVCGVTEEAES